MVWQWAELSVDELAQRCQKESLKYRFGQPHDETYCLELFRRAILNHDQSAWAAIYSQYQNLVADWIRQHRRFQRIQEDAEVLVNVAFMRFWHTVSKPDQEVQFDRLGKLLQYLKSCVHSVIKDAYRRQERRPQEALIWDELSEALVEDLSSLETRILSQMEMEALQWSVWSQLRGETEVVVATLSWLDGLSPKEIQAHRPDLFANVRRVYRIKRNILDRLLRDADIQKLLKHIR